MGGGESKTVMKDDFPEDKIVVDNNKYNKNNETVVMEKFNNKYKKLSINHLLFIIICMILLYILIYKMI